MARPKQAVENRLPSDLSPSAQTWGVRVLREFAVDDAAGLLLLGEALRAWDRAREAGEAIQRDGAIFKDRFEQLRAHPAVAIERDARASMLAAFRALHLDVEPPKANGRPTR